MIKRLTPALLALALAGPACAQTASVTAPAAPDLVAEAGAQEKVLVVGQRPGPGLWKVSKGEHVLWIFGTYGPLPSKMTWRSQQVETILAQSQEAIANPSASPKIGILKSLSLAPHLFGLTKNPDGATLKQLLPADVYARWEVMRKKYMADADMEHVRPLFAAEGLYGAGLEKAGLTTKGEVSKAIGELVKKSKIKVTSVSIEFAVDDPAAALKMFKRAPLDDAACLSKTIGRLESDIEGMKERANAWAKGDLAEIRKLDFDDRENACKDAMMRSAAMRSALKVDEIEPQLRAAWLAAADKALANNASTFAILSIKKLLDPKGVVADLQGKGYQVEIPD